MSKEPKRVIVAKRMMKAKGTSQKRKTETLNKMAKQPRRKFL